VRKASHLLFFEGTESIRRDQRGIKYRLFITIIAISSINPRLPTFNQTDIFSASALVHFYEHFTIYNMTTGNVIGGHKANINNPSMSSEQFTSCSCYYILLSLILIVTDTSEESKQHSREILDNEYDGGNIETHSDENKNPNNVAGGLKATINNPNVSEEAKQSAKERLDQM